MQLVAKYILKINYKYSITEMIFRLDVLADYRWCVSHAVYTADYSTVTDKRQPIQNADMTVYECLLISCCLFVDNRPYHYH